MFVFTDLIVPHRPRLGYRTGCHHCRMDGRARDLLRQIEQGVTGEDENTATLVRKALVLGGLVASTDLRDWARRELNGYGNDDDLPEYRKIQTGIYVDGVVGGTIITGLQISASALPKAVREAGIANEVELRMSLAELESMAHSDGNSVMLSLPDAPLIARMLDAASGQAPFQQTSAVYYKVTAGTITGVVDRVRTGLAELVGELLETAPNETDAPSKAATDQAVNLVVTGRRHRINVAATQSGTLGESSINPSPPDGDETWWARWRKRGLIIGLSTVVAAVAVVATWLEWTPWK